MFINFPTCQTAFVKDSFFIASSCDCNGLLKEMFPHNSQCLGVRESCYKFSENGTGYKSINFNEIDKFKVDMVEAYKNKLKNNIDKIFNDKKELADEKRLEFEITLFSDKVDVTEEIVRFNSHIDKFLKTVKEFPPVGKKLDFILQEMNREINTIGSKNTLKNISNIVIDSKTTIEKIREQVQNIE